MKKLNLREHVRDYYEQEQLSEQILERMIESEDLKTKSRPRGKIHWVLTAAALIVACAVGALLLTENQSGKEAVAVAEEIAIKHNMQLLPQLETTDYRELGNMMERLDFDPVDSPRLQRSGLHLIGGLYCSLKGQLAAQIKLRDSEGELVTLYQTKDSQLFEELTESKIKVSGIEITQWREQGVYMGLAR